MGKTGGFLKHGRQEPGYRPVDERIKDFKAVEIPFMEDAVHVQMARCMECGTPFCYACGCPLSNIIPELNTLAGQQRWSEALALLVAANPLPEFTGRLCPAPCEAACVLALNDEAVTIRQIELAIIEEGFAKGYLHPAPPPERFEERIAVIGSGPAGLAVADTLNKAGYPVVIYERAAKIGGILRYGIPDFKLEKWILDRRIRLMEQEGIRFETGVNVGTDISCKYLRSRFNAICLCGGAGEPRDLRVPGRDLAGIHFAMDYLVAQNRKNAGEYLSAAADIDARGKSVVIIGGGDTGADCLGTAIRQGAKSVLQLEILPEPPPVRPATTPWPMWPFMRRDSTSHKEGGSRRWGVGTVKFRGRNGHVTGLDCVEGDMRRQADGRVEFIPRPGTGFELKAELVLLALGYVATRWDRIADDLHLERDGQENIEADGYNLVMGQSMGEGMARRKVAPYVGPQLAEAIGIDASPFTTPSHNLTNAQGVFIAGDMRTGPSLVARAIADGISAARGIMKLGLRHSCEKAVFRRLGETPRPTIPEESAPGRANRPW